MKGRKSSSFVNGWFAVASLFYIVAAACLGYYDHESHRKESIREIDQRLLVAARSIRYILPENYHDSKNHKKDYIKYRPILSKFSEEGKFKFLYAVVAENGQAYETATSELEEAVVEEGSAEYGYYDGGYYEPYEDFDTRALSLLTDPANTKDVFLDFVSDRWGFYRTACVKEVSPKGNTYLSCADYDLTDVDEELSKELQKSLLLYMILFLASFPMFLVLRFSYKGREAGLQSLVDARTKGLQEALTEAENSNRTKSQFLANMSHELRTPLNAVIGFSEAMQAGIFGPLNNPHYEEYASNIHSCGKHLLYLINDILDLSKIDADAMVLKLEKVDLVDVVREAFDIVTGYPTADTKILRFDRPSEKLKIVCDERLMRQVALNLLSNAIKFTPEGKEITVNLSRVSESEVEFVVKDQGVGISGKNLEKVFEPFVQIGNIYSKNHAGTGLGLPISKKVVEMHKGSIKLESVEGKGTTITVRLPVNLGA